MKTNQTQFQADTASDQLEIDRLSAELADLRACKSALKLLLNLHDGVADGGNGILPEDWENARFIANK